MCLPLSSMCKRLCVCERECAGWLGVCRCVRVRKRGSSIFPLLSFYGYEVGFSLYRAVPLSSDTEYVTRQRQYGFFSRQPIRIFQCNYFELRINHLPTRTSQDISFTAKKKKEGGGGKKAGRGGEEN